MGGAGIRVTWRELRQSMAHGTSARPNDGPRYQYVSTLTQFALDPQDKPNKCRGTTKSATVDRLIASRQSPHTGFRSGAAPDRSKRTWQALSCSVPSQPLPNLVTLPHVIFMRSAKKRSRESSGDGEDDRDAG